MFLLFNIFVVFGVNCFSMPYSFLVNGFSCQFHDVYEIRLENQRFLVGIFTPWITKPLAFVCDILQCFFEILLGIGCQAGDLLENLVKGQRSMWEEYLF